MKLKQGIVSLYKKVATSLPPDVEAALKEAASREPAGTPVRLDMDGMLSTVGHCRGKARPLCLDIGVPVFYVSAPAGLRHADIRQTIIEATREATAKIPLPSNAVDPLTHINSGDNTGEGFPVIQIEEAHDGKLVVELMMLAADTERLGKLYCLPDEGIGAGRDLDGVRKCVLETVRQAKGAGCPPYIIGVGIGPTRDQAARLSKEQLRRKLADTNPVAELAAFEAGALAAVNALGIEGSTTALGVKAGAHHRHPDSFFADVTVMCWNTRRGKLIW